MAVLSVCGFVGWSATETARSRATGETFDDRSNEEDPQLKFTHDIPPAQAGMFIVKAFPNQDKKGLRPRSWMQMASMAKLGVSPDGRLVRPHSRLGRESTQRASPAIVGGGGLGALTHIAL